MKIQTWKNQYQILQILSEENGIESMIAKRESEEGLFFLLHVEDQVLVKTMIPYFMQLQEQRTPEDLEECFSKEGDFFAVFRWYDQPAFLVKIEQPLNFIEKLELLKNLLERLISLKLPEYLMYEVLNFKNITVSDSLFIEFHYMLYEGNVINQIQFQNIAKRLSEVIKKLFVEELHKEMCPELKALIAKLEEEGYYLGILSIYQQYREIYQEYRSGNRIPQENRPEFRIWKRIKQCFPKLKRVLKMLLLLLLFIYLLDTIRYPVPGTGERYQFTRIGTLDLQTNED